jgi:flagellar biosynthesis/type III secretory pathway protein FliH
MTTPRYALYSTIARRIWDDAKFRKLTPLAPSGQACFITLLTTRYNTCIPGVILAGKRTLAESARWTDEAFDEAFQEVFREGMAKANWEAQLVWLPNATKFNPCTAPNVAKSWGRFIHELPECDLQVEIIAGLKAYFTQIADEAFSKAFAEGLGNGFLKAFNEGMPKGLDDGFGEAIGDTETVTKTETKPKTKAHFRNQTKIILSEMSKIVMGVLLVDEDKCLNAIQYGKPPVDLASLTGITGWLKSMVPTWSERDPGRRPYLANVIERKDWLTIHPPTGTVPKQAESVPSRFFGPCAYCGVVGENLSVVDGKRFCSSAHLEAWRRNGSSKAAIVAPVPTSCSEGPPPELGEPDPRNDEPEHREPW